MANWLSFSRCILKAELTTAAGWNSLVASLVPLRSAAALLNFEDQLVPHFELIEVCTVAFFARPGVARPGVARPFFYHTSACRRGREAHVFFMKPLLSPEQELRDIKLD